MNSLKDFVLLFILLLVQVLVLNQVHLLGFANPMLFLLFFIVFPKQKSKINLLLLGFFSGLFLDFFSDTGGIYAISTLCICYFRASIIKFVLGDIAQEKQLHLMEFSLGKRLFYILLFVLVHQILFYWFEFFSFVHWQKMLYRISVSTLLTTIVCVLMLSSFQKR